MYEPQLIWPLSVDNPWDTQVYRLCEWSTYTRHATDLVSEVGYLQSFLFLLLRLDRKYHNSFLEGLGWFTGAMAFAWSSFRLPRPWSRSQENDSSPSLPYENGFPVDNIRQEREIPQDLGDTDVDTLRQMQEQLLRVWSRISPEGWEQEVQAISERFRVSVTEVDMGLTTSAVDSGPSCVEGLGAGMMPGEPGVRKSRTTWGGAIPKSMGSQERCLSWAPPVSSRYIGSPGIDQPGYTLAQDVSLGGIPHVWTVGFEATMTDTGLPWVNFSESTAGQRMDMGHVSQIPAVTMVTQPTNTYTWQRPIMSYFASDTPVYSAGETPMVEETSLHGRIWLPGSHSTPLGQPLEHRQETVPKTSLVHGEPWQLVS